MAPPKQKLYRHATIYQIGWLTPVVDTTDPKKHKVVTTARWSTLFSNSRKVCDMCNYDARDDHWESMESVLAFVKKWVEPTGSVFVSFLDNQGERDGQFIQRSRTVVPDAPAVNTHVKLKRS